MKKSPHATVLRPDFLLRSPEKVDCKPSNPLHRVGHVLSTRTASQKDTLSPVVKSHTTTHVANVHTVCRQSQGSQSTYRPQHPKYPSSLTNTLQTTRIVSSFDHKNQAESARVRWQNGSRSLTTVTGVTKSTRRSPKQFDEYQTKVRNFPKTTEFAGPRQVRVQSGTGLVLRGPNNHNWHQSNADEKIADSSYRINPQFRERPEAYSGAPTYRYSMDHQTQLNPNTHGLSRGKLNEYDYSIPNPKSNHRRVSSHLSTANQHLIRPASSTRRQKARHFGLTRSAYDVHTQEDPSSAARFGRYWTDNRLSQDARLESNVVFPGNPRMFRRRTDISQISRNIEQFYRGKKGSEQVQQKDAERGLSARPNEPRMASSKEATRYKNRKASKKSKQMNLVRNFCKNMNLRRDSATRRSRQPVDSEQTRSSKNQGRIATNNREKSIQDNSRVSSAKNSERSEHIRTKKGEKIEVWIK